MIDLVECFTVDGEYDKTAIYGAVTRLEAKIVVRTRCKQRSAGCSSKVDSRRARMRGIPPTTV